ncbi:MAG: hypothetical protein JNL05_11575 [Flavobacteriales bacterium]|nr:hypothetical protein [Flavobacteriales bacterium]
MMMVRYVLLVCVVLTALRLSGQDVLRGIVLDSADGSAVVDAQLGWAGEGVAAVTDEEGRFTIDLRNAGTLLEVTHVAYRTQRIAFPGAKGLEAGRWEIRLGARTILLAAAEVRRPEPEVVFQREDLHAADLFVNHDGLWVLAYERPRLFRAESEQGREILRDVRLVLLDTVHTELASLPMQEDVLGLHHDLRDLPIVRGTTLAYGVSYHGGGLRLAPFPLEQLDRAVLPWTDSIPGWVLGTRKDDVQPRVDHLGHDPVMDSSVLVAAVLDSFMMQLFRSEYKYLSGHDKVVAMDLARQFRTDPEVVAGYMAGFDRNIWFKPVYAPMFVVDDTIVVFDHYRGRLCKYNGELRLCGEVPIVHHMARQGRDWKGRIIQDAATGALYAEYQRSGQGWVQRIDARTGRPGAITRITHRYPEKVQVYDGGVYYIHRAQGSLQKRTLYREPLR